MAAPFQRRYPFAALRDVVDPRHERTNLELAELLGVHPRQLRRYMQHGVTDCAADRVAVRAGVHPAVVWPEWMSAGAAWSHGGLMLQCQDATHAASGGGGAP